MSLHLIADFSKCDLFSLAPDHDTFLNQIKFFAETISKNGLRVVGQSHYFFAPHSVTAGFCLAESHLHFHSWPEKNFVHFDILVCHFSRDNSTTAENLFRFFRDEVFCAGRTELTRLSRAPRI